MSTNTKKSFAALLVLCLLATGTLACGDEEFEENQDDEQVNQNQNQQDEDQNQGESEQIEVAGTWETPFETVEVIDDEMWGFMYLIDFDNDQRWAITQNPDDDDHNPDAFNRLHWTPIENDTFYYCTVAFGLDTEQEARDTDATADEGDLDGGCGGFPWTEMTRQ